MALGATNRVCALWDSEANMKQRPCKSKTDHHPESMATSLTLILQLIPLIIIVSFILQQHHLLITLLALEGVTLRLVLSIPLTLRINSISLRVLSIIILSFGACEASLGLALLVIIARSHGNDIVNNLTLNKC